MARKLPLLAPRVGPIVWGLLWAPNWKLITEMALMLPGPGQVMGDGERMEPGGGGPVPGGGTVGGWGWWESEGGPPRKLQLPTSF